MNIPANIRRLWVTKHLIIKMSIRKTNNECWFKQNNLKAINHMKESSSWK